MRICIIGAGSIANNVHLPSILRYEKLHGGLEIAACSDIVPENARNLAERYGIPYIYENNGRMLKEQNPDAVVCLVKENAMAEVCADILTSGYPVLLEKPPGKTKAEVLSIANASAHSGKMHMVAFNRRHMPVMTKLRELAGQHKINHIVYDLYRKKRFDNNFEDTAIHAVDAVKWIAGSEYKSAEIFYDEMPHKGKNVANYYIYAVFESQATASIRILVDTQELRERAEVHTDSNIIIANAAYAGNPSATGGVQAISDSKITFSASGEQLAGTALPYVLDGFYFEHEYFYECIKSGTNPAHNALSAVQSVEICEAIKNRLSSLRF